MTNDGFVQVRGPFTAYEDIVSDIRKEDVADFAYVKTCGVQCKPRHQVCINGNIFEIGKAKLLEFKNIKITSLYFLQDEPASALVDCILTY